MTLENEDNIIFNLKHIRRIMKKYDIICPIRKANPYKQMLKKDLYFFLGTTRKFHNVGKNPFIIIGLFYPPVDNEPSLF